MLFFVPSLILDLLQYRHIKCALGQKEVLLSAKDYQEAGRYALRKLRINIVQETFGVLLFAFWISCGFKWLNAYTPQILDLKVSSSVLIVLEFLILSQIVFLPFKYYREMVLDKQFGFSKQSNRLFFVDFLKGVLLSIVVGGMILYILMRIMESVQLWWVWGAVFVFMIMIFINFAYPTLIAPLFNTFSPLQDERLQQKIEALLEQVGFKSNGIFVMDASKRDGRLNAYFCGFGKNKRVVLFDTLLEKISCEGLIAILGHELGHFKHKDLIFNLFIQGFFLFLIFFVAGSLPAELFDGLQLERGPGNLLNFLILIAPIVSFWFLPLVGYFSRRAEFRADGFGASLSSKKTLAEALVRLVNENKSFPSSHPWYIFFHFTHPPLLERLKALDYEV